MSLSFGKWRSRSASTRSGAFAILAGAILALAPAVSAQAVQSGDQGGPVLSAGILASGDYLQYGERKMIGLAGFVDADARSHLGLEAEGRWMEFRQSANVHAETYSIGVRYHRTYDNLQPYVKGLIGFGDFNFPYNLATGRYLVVTGGAGMDWLLSRRIQIRTVDVEYQDWPQFTFGNMSTLGVSAGLRIRIY